MIWDHPAKLILFRKLPALPCIQMHRVPQEEHLSLLQHFCTQAACIRGPGHNAECPMRYHFACTLPGFSCQLRAAEKDNAFSRLRKASCWTQSAKCGGTGSSHGPPSWICCT